MGLSVGGAEQKQKQELEPPSARSARPSQIRELHCQPRWYIRPAFPCSIPLQPLENLCSPFHFTPGPNHLTVLFPSSPSFLFNISPSSKSCCQVLSEPPFVLHALLNIDTCTPSRMLTEGGAWIVNKGRRHWSRVEVEGQSFSNYWKFLFPFQRNCFSLWVGFHRIWIFPQFRWRKIKKLGFKLVPIKYFPFPLPFFIVLVSCSVDYKLFSYFLAVKTRKWVLEVSHCRMITFWLED